MKEKKIFSNLLWRLAERCGAQGVTFIVSVILARILDPSVYGTVALVTVFTTILQVFVDSGFGTALIQKKDADDIDFSSVFYFNIVSCAVMYAIMFFCAPLIASFYDKPELVSLVRVQSLILIISGVKNVQQAYVSRNLLFKKFFFATLGGTLGAAGLGIWMAYSGYGVWAVVAQNLFNHAVDTVILWITVKWRPKKVFSLERLKGLFRFGNELGVPMEERNARTVAEAAAKLPLVYEPGTQQAYNTAAFDIAARVIEITSGMDFAEYLKVNIFDKLGMTDTTFEPSAEQWSRMVAVHGCENGKAYDVPYDGQIFGAYPVTYHAAGAALTSTAADYDKFARMLLNGGAGDNGERVMSEESVKLMATPVVDDSIMAGSQKWGLGVRVITDNDYTLPKGTFGWSGMFGTHFWIDPVNRITAVYMKNSTYDGGAGCQTANELEKDVTDSFTVKRIK